MLESRIMARRRTTVAADSGALATIEAEARRRGVPLTAVLAEAIDEKAAALRAGRRPRLGVARSTDGRRASEVASDPVARDVR